MRSVVLSLVALVLMGSAALALERPVPGYGAFTAMPEAGEQPDPARLYEVVFDVSGGGDVASPSRGLDRVARYVNLLANGGVDTNHRRIVVVGHGAASQAVLTDIAWAARHDAKPNPSAELVRQLLAAGVDVRICGQAMVGQTIAPEDLARGVKVDLAALMTVTHLQQRGYALVVK